MPTGTPGPVGRCCGTSCAGADAGKRADAGADGGKGACACAPAAASDAIAMVHLAAAVIAFLTMVFSLGDEVLVFVP